MKEVDYLIVGFGIGGACFAKQCIEANRSFHIVSDMEPKATMVAAGMFNPIILFRFTTVHRAVEHMDLLKKTFAEFEVLLGEKLVHEKKIFRIFANENETKIWKKKIAKKPILQKFLNPEIINDKIENIEAPFGFGEVNGCGWVDMKLLISKFYERYTSHFTVEDIDYDKFDSEKLTYKNIKAKKVIFAEGVKVENNPFFKYVPVKKNKGETLIIQSGAELPDVIFKSKNFLMPLQDDLYYVGATYDREDKSSSVTNEKRQELENKLKTYFKGNYEVVEHRSAFRPVLEDRRGVIGEHPLHKNLYLLNGMGTRGTFHGPSMSKYLFENIEKQKPIPEEYRVERYNNLTQS